VIEVLQKAQIRCGMVTGDHLRTAISVALQCGVLPAARPVLLVDGEGGGGGLSRATAGGSCVQVSCARKALVREGRGWVAGDSGRDWLTWGLRRCVVGGDDSGSSTC
jgi:magnesium-transporting ATPase (P-type)